MATKTKTTTRKATANKAQAKPATTSENVENENVMQLALQGARPTVTRGYIAAQVLVQSGFKATFANVEKDTTGGATAQAMVQAGCTDNTSENVFHGKYAVHALNGLLNMAGIVVTYKGKQIKGIAPKGNQTAK